MNEAALHIRGVLGRTRGRAAPLKIALAAALVALKLWLVRAQALTGIGDSPGDDRLYLELASELTQGRWLGPYRSVTLAKNPLYPLWVAGTYCAGVPLLIAQHLLYAVACALVALAVAPVMPRRIWTWLLFAILLLNPISFADGVMTRAAREGIYPALALLVFAGGAGVVTRLDAPLAALTRWAVLLGAAVGALLLCREEGIWIAPLLLATGAAAWKRATWRRAASAFLLAGAVASLAVGVVLWKNWSHYGIAVLSEQSNGAFPRAYGAVARVRHAHWRRYVPVPRETRERIYAVSPRFAELAPSLEGPDRGAWMAPGCSWFGICDEVYTGLFLWQMRAAAVSAGHMRSGPAGEAFWDALAAEVNAACEAGRLDCGPRRSTLVPPWRREYLPLTIDAFARGLRFVATFEQVTPHPTASAGPLSLLDVFRDMTRERLAGLDVAASPREERLDRQRLAVLEGILRGYRVLLPAAALFAILAWVIGLVRCVRRRQEWTLQLIAAAALVGFLCRVAALSLVDAMAFPGIIVLYLSAAYPLLAAFVPLGLASAFGRAAPARGAIPRQQTAGFEEPASP
jgi:hypothetical protein